MEKFITIFLILGCGHPRKSVSEGVSLVLTMRAASAGTWAGPALLSAGRLPQITQQLGRNKAETGSHVTSKKPMQVVQSNLHHKAEVNAFHNST